MVLYMPMAVLEAPFVPKTAAVLTMTLPACLMFSDATRGAWQDCYRDPNKVLYLNTFLYLLDLAQKLEVSTYIETIADNDLLSNKVTTVARFYRVFVPLSEANARDACFRMSTHLQKRVAEAVNPQSNPNQRSKRRRRDSAQADPYEPSDALTNTELGWQHVHSEQVLLQYYATATAGNSCQHFQNVNWTMPPQELTGGGDLGLGGEFDDDMSDIESDAEDAASNSVVGGGVSDVFTTFYDALPDNHPLKIFGIETMFHAGLQRFDTVHTQQLTLSNYFVDNVLTFPPACVEQGLLTVLHPQWPGFQTNGVNDLVANFALPAATQVMTTLELFKKMKEMHAFRGTTIDPSYANLSFEELKDIWLQKGINAQEHASGELHDASYYNFIEQILPCDQPQLNFYRSKSDQVLGEIYPALGRLQFGVHQEYKCVLNALLEHRIHIDIVIKWRRHLLERIQNLFLGNAQMGFVQSYFKILKEALGIIDFFNMPEANSSVVIKHAKLHLQKQYPNMDPGNAMQYTMAGLLSGPLHLTPAQSSTTLFAWNSSLTALKPEIGKAQTIICLFGQSDSGKSAMMDTATTLMPQTAIVRKDTSSKLAFTANNDIGVHVTDEFKLGVPSSGDKNVEQLSVFSTGINVHSRLKLAQNKGETTHNESVMADGRQYLLTATNEILTRAYASRVVGIYCPGTEVEGGRTRQEMVTINNDLPEYQSAVMMFRYVWSLSATVHTTQQVMPFKYCTALRALWYALTKKIMGKLYAPAPRQVDQIMELSKGFYHARVAAEYIALPAEHRKMYSFIEFMAANPVIQMSDMMQCFVQREQNTDIEHETTQVLQALLESICLTEEQPQELVMKGDYYYTCLKTIADICQKCTGGLQNAVGIVTDVYQRLLRGNGSASPPSIVVINKRGPWTNHIAVHKNVLLKSKHVHTKAHAAILSFLVDGVLHEAAGAMAATMWHYSYCEQWINFRRPVRDRIRGDYNHINRYADAAQLRGDLSQTDFDRALLVWEIAAVVQYRVKDTHPPDLAADSALISESAVLGGGTVDRAGPLDPCRFLPDYFETDESDHSDTWFAEQMVRAGMLVRPVRPKSKSKLRTQSVLRIAHSVLKPYLDNIERKKLQMPEVPVMKESKTERENLIKGLWNMAAAITGESKPGDKVCNGIDHRSLRKCKTHTIQTINMLEIKLMNPMRHTGSAVSASDSTATSIENKLFPPEKPEVTFKLYNGVPLIDALNKEAAVTLNGMPPGWVKLHA